MKRSVKRLLLSSCITCALSSHTLYATVSIPALMLANEYQSPLDIHAYWLSEKMDGIRAYWTGSKLITRNGRQIHAPDWFTRALPDIPLEGELWAGRGQFPLVQQTVLDHQPNDTGWQKIRLMLFDLPGYSGDYAERYQHLEDVVKGIDRSYIRRVPQTTILSQSWLEERLTEIEEAGGEGLMLRRFGAPYRTGRSNDLIKLKSHQENEAVVVGYRAGKGKYSGQVGSLRVRTPDGRHFYIGSGLSDKLRQSPPEVGVTVTYRYNGVTSSGLPRFARFIRIREGE